MYEIVASKIKNQLIFVICTIVSKSYSITVDTHLSFQWYFRAKKVILFDHPVLTRSHQIILGVASSSSPPMTFKKTEWAGNGDLLKKVQ